MKLFIMRALATGPFAVALALVAHLTPLDWRWWIVSISGFVSVALFLAVEAKAESAKAETAKKG